MSITIKPVTLTDAPTLAKINEFIWNTPVSCDIIEKNTFIPHQGFDGCSMHHYFDEQEIRDVFKQWKIIILAEKLVNYIETEPEFYKTNPFPYTKWQLLVQKQNS